MILITGASGFVGSHLLNEASTKFGKENILAVSSRDIAVCPTITYKNFSFELSTIDSIMLSQVDVLIHVGSFTPKAAEEANLIERCSENIYFTQNLLALPFTNLKKVIFISTLDVYEQCDEISESSRTIPTSLYGLSKLYCEQMINSFIKTHDIEYQVLRLGHVYGPGEEKYRKFIPEAIRKILSGNDIEVWGDGSEIRSFIFIDDVVTSIINAIDLVKNVGPINIVGGYPITIREILEKLIHISGKTVSVVTKQSMGENRSYNFNNSKMLKYLLTKETNLCDGLHAEYAYMEQRYEHNI